MVKLPTGDTDSGAGTGKADFALDAIVSKEINERVEVSGYGGFIVRGLARRGGDDQRVPVGLGRRLPVAQVAAVHGGADGEAYSNEHAGTKQVLLGGGRVVPAGRVHLRHAGRRSNLNLGLTWQGANGVFAGAGWTWRIDDGHARAIS